MSSQSSKKIKRDNKNKPSGIKGLNYSNTELKLTRIAIHYEYLFNWGVNFKERTIVLSSDIDSEAFELVEAAMSEMESENRRRTITIKINSEGGNVYDALAIVGRMLKSPCKTTTEGYGFVASASTLILAAGDKRKISELAWFMHHESSYELEGKLSEVKDCIKQGERENEQWATWMAKFTKKNKQFWLKEGTYKDAYFDADQLLTMGVADETF